MIRLSPLLAVAALAILLAVPSAAPAQRYNVTVGIGDQSKDLFQNERYQALGLRKVRYFIRWNAIDNDRELQLADEYMDAAEQAGAEVLLHISSDTLDRREGRLPSLASYRSKVGRLVRRYRDRIDAIGVWNEVNHDSQPTWNNPRRAAQYFLAMRQMCAGCTIVALDVLDQSGVERYMRRWFRALGRRNRSKAGIVGIHNYSDTNRFRDRGTRQIIRELRRHNRRAKVWFTETGGVVKFGTSFPCVRDAPAAAERRAARAVDYMFSLTRRFRRDVQRLYMYNFFGDDCVGRFDAGLVRRDGTPRPGYERVRRGLRNFRR
jgi:hypothetical protein